MKILLFATLIFSLAPAHASVPAALQSNPHRAVVFLPGYMGSFLRDKNTKERVYVSLESILINPGTLSLYQKELDTPAGPELELDGVMDNVAGVDVYGSMMDKLKTLPGTEVVPFGYDWRQDPYEAVTQLGHVIDGLKAKGMTEIDLVAHSGGGWVVSYYLAYGTQDLENCARGLVRRQQFEESRFDGHAVSGRLDHFPRDGKRKFAADDGRADAG